MTIFTDDLGNYFLGNCSYGTHSGSYPSKSYLLSRDLTTLSSDLTDLFTSAGLPFRNVISQSIIDNWLNSSGSPIQHSLIHFGVAGDIDDRFSFATTWAGNNTGSGGPVNLFNDSGSLNQSNAINESSNLVSRAEYPTGSPYGVNGGMLNINWVQPFEGIASEYSPIQVLGVANSYSVSLYFYQTRLTEGSGLGFISQFFHAGVLNNTNSNYNTLLSTCFILSGGSPTVTQTQIPILNGRYNGNYPLTTGKADYPIACSDGQIPTNQWATDMYVFDSSNEFYIGKCQNLLLAEGTFTIGKPITLQGVVQPASGFNGWLPIGIYAGKTLLMRCYSSTGFN